MADEGVPDDGKERDYRAYAWAITSKGNVECKTSGSDYELVGSLVSAKTHTERGIVTIVTTETGTSSPPTLPFAMHVAWPAS
jgi:hypothetical protein